MKPRKRSREKKYFTVAQANATLPLIRAILRDLTTLARELKDRHDRLERFQGPDGGNMGEAHQEELQQVLGDFERDQERMREYLQELKTLGIELKDELLGLVDFPSWMDGREVYLCWRLDEPEVAHWHDLDAGFRGRQKLLVDAVNP
jgi:hypothetical protein